MASGQCAAEGGGYGPGESLSLTKLLLDQVLQAAGVSRKVSSWLVLVVGDDLPRVAHDLVDDGLQVGWLLDSTCACVHVAYDLIRLEKQASCASATRSNLCTTGTGTSGSRMTPWAFATTAVSSPSPAGAVQRRSP